MIFSFFFSQVRVANLRRSHFCHFEFHTNEPIRNLKTRKKLRLNFHLRNCAFGQMASTRSSLQAKRKLTYKHIKLIPYKVEHLLKLVPRLHITHLKCAMSLNMRRSPMLKMADISAKRERKIPKRFIDEFVETKPFLLTCLFRK